MTLHDKEQGEKIEIALIEYGFNAHQAEFLARVASNKLLRTVQHEQDRQVERWGVTDHPSFGEDARAEKANRVVFANTVKEEVSEAAREGKLTWEHILIEEVFEAKAEVDSPMNLKMELIQIAAVALSWVESIERQAAAKNQAIIEDNANTEQDHE